MIEKSDQDSIAVYGYYQRMDMSLDACFGVL